MTPTQIMALQHARAIYEVNGVGCCWHIVLDDSNLHEDWIRSTAADCGRSCSWNTCEVPDHCEALGPLLLGMSEPERDEFFDVFNEWAPGTAEHIDDDQWEPTP